MGAHTSHDHSRHDHGEATGAGQDHDHAPHDHAAHDHGGHDHGGHDHGGHDHGGHGGIGHSHAPTSFGTAFLIAILLNVGIVLAEVTSGLIGHSVALIADAGHNFSDVLGLCAAYAAHTLGKRAPSSRFTYGLGGTSILAALFNAVTLLVVTGALSWAAILRFFNPEPVGADLVMAVSAAAILVNGASALLLAPGKQGDLNLRAAVAHLLADAAISAGVVVGAGLILLTGWTWIDPAISLLINATIILGTWTLLRESVSMSLAGVPRSVRHADVRAYLAGLPGVARLHDLHIWPMSTSETAMTVHLVMPSGHPGDGFLMQICLALRHQHGIGHATMQVETDDATACALAPDHVV